MCASKMTLAHFHAGFGSVHIFDRVVSCANR